MIMMMAEDLRHAAPPEAALLLRRGQSLKTVPELAPMDAEPAFDGNHIRRAHWLGND